MVGIPGRSKGGNTCIQRRIKASQRAATVASRSAFAADTLARPCTSSLKMFASDTATSVNLETMAGPSSAMAGLGCRIHRSSLRPRRTLGSCPSLLRGSHHRATHHFCRMESIRDRDLISWRQLYHRCTTIRQLATASLHFSLQLHAQPWHVDYYKLTTAQRGSNVDENWLLQLQGGVMDSPVSVAAYAVARP